MTRSGNESEYIFTNRTVCFVPKHRRMLHIQADETFEEIFDASCRIFRGISRRTFGEEKFAY